MSETDTDENGEGRELSFPDEAKPYSPANLYITTSRGDTKNTRHIWNTTNDGLMKTACGVQNKIDPDDYSWTTANARELFLSHIVTEGNLCKSCRRSADLDNHVDLEEIEQFIEGFVEDSEDRDPIPELPGDARETIPVSVDINIDAELPVNERTYRLLETIGTAAAEQTALERRNDDVIDVDSLENGDG